MTETEKYFRQKIIEIFDIIEAMKKEFSNQLKQLE